MSLGFCVLSVENETKKDQQLRQKGTGQSWEVPHGTAETDLFRSLLDEMMKSVISQLWVSSSPEAAVATVSNDNTFPGRIPASVTHVQQSPGSGGGQTTSLFQLSRDLLQAYGLSVNKTRG